MPVYQRQGFSHCLLVGNDSSCWLIDTSRRAIWYPSCQLIPKESGPAGLEIMPAQLRGKPWLDVQADCGVSFSGLWGRPSFDDQSVSFSDCGAKVDVFLDSS